VKVKVKVKVKVGVRVNALPALIGRLLETEPTREQGLGVRD